MKPLVWLGSCALLSLIATGTIQLIINNDTASKEEIVIRSVVSAARNVVMENWLEMLNHQKNKDDPDKNREQRDTHRYQDRHRRKNRPVYDRPYDDVIKRIGYSPSDKMGNRYSRLPSNPAELMVASASDSYSGGGQYPVSYQKYDLSHLKPILWLAALLIFGFLVGLAAVQNILAYISAYCCNSTLFTTSTGRIVDLMLVPQRIAGASSLMGSGRRATTARPSRRPRPATTKKSVRPSTVAVRRTSTTTRRPSVAPKQQSEALVPPGTKDLSGLPFFYILFNETVNDDDGSNDLIFKRPFNVNSLK